MTTLSRKPMSATTLTGDDIKNEKDETLGSVEDIMIDCSTGRVAYVVMSAGGFLGLGEKFFALPISVLNLDSENKCFRTDIDKEAFKNAEGFDKNDWPDMASPDWEEINHKKFNAKPYWQ